MSSLLDDLRQLQRDWENEWDEGDDAERAGEVTAYRHCARELEELIKKHSQGGVTD